MFPTLAIPYVVDERPGYSISRGHGSLRARRFSYLQNLLWGQFVVSVFLPMHAMITSFADFVFDVVVIRAGEKMVRMDAWRVIAAVKDMKPFRNWTHTTFVGNAMRSLILATDPEDSISVLVSVPGPFYAAGFSNDGSIGKSMMNGSHVNVPSIRAVRARTGVGTSSEPELYTGVESQ